jgi:hypothetical protein
LSGVADIFNHSQVTLKDAALSFVARGELKLIAQGGFARGSIRTDRHMDFVKDVVVEIVFVGPDAGFLMWINAQGGDQRLPAACAPHKRVDISGVGRRVPDDERRIHVA